MTRDIPIFVNHQEGANLNIVTTSVFSAPEMLLNMSSSTGIIRYVVAEQYNTPTGVRVTVYLGNPATLRSQAVLKSSLKLSSRVLRSSLVFRF